MTQHDTAPEFHCGWLALREQGHYAFLLNCGKTFRTKMFCGGKKANNHSSHARVKDLSGNLIPFVGGAKLRPVFSSQTSRMIVTCRKVNA